MVSHSGLNRAAYSMHLDHLVLQIHLPRQDLWLPTNPESRVIAAIAESATPMQSAAKVPILVAFKVKSGNYSLLASLTICSCTCVKSGCALVARLADYESSIAQQLYRLLDDVSDCRWKTYVRTAKRGSKLACSKWVMTVDRMFLLSRCKPNIYCPHEQQNNSLPRTNENMPSQNK